MGNKADLGDSILSIGEMPEFAEQYGFAELHRSAVTDQGMVFLIT
jgi:hypothetical protein